VNAESPELAIVVVTTLLFIIILPLAFAQAVLPTAKIVSIDYPVNVIPGKVFPVSVQAEYSIISGVDVGIWDLKAGVVLQSASIPLPSLGKTIFSFKLTAPSTEGDWRLAAITRIFWQDAWYQDPRTGSENFTVNVSNNVTILLSSEGSGSTITVDGSQYRIGEAKSASLLLKPGLHMLEALPLIQMEPSKRFVFVGWSDGINSNPRQLVVNEGAKITSIYRTEYYLTVKSIGGNVSGEGWYEQGSQASFAAIPSYTIESWFGLLPGQYRFGGWSGDSDSSDAVASITMDGPKTVEATWAYSGTTPNPALLSGIFYLGSLVLAVRGLHKYSSRRHARTRISFRKAKRWVKLIVPLSAFILATLLVPPVYSQLPEQPERTIVTIGDASWYYWKKGASDTCILWLGGGIAQEGGPGYDQYWINPYEYESFGTIRFLQDLTKYYCVIALEKGSYKYVQPESNRTIYQEPYQSQSQIITQVHDWILGQGYEHTYLVGYSVGAEVAAMEVTMQSPEEWTSPDGLILITPRLSNDQIQSAYRARTSLLVLYGGSIETPQYIVTGQEFFNETGEGWHGSYYLHKEYHIIEKMGHEVWTVFKSGIYDTQALHILVNFVETSKALQLKPEETASIVSQVNNFTTQNSAANLRTLRAPQSIPPNQILAIEANVFYSSPDKMLVRAIALDKRSQQIESIVDLSIVGDGQRLVNLLVSPPFNSYEISLEIILLQKLGTGWLPITRAYSTTTSIADKLALTLEATVPNVSLVFDGTQYTVSKPVQLETEPGMHTLQLQPVIYISSLTRAVFTKWEDGTSTVVRQVSLDSNATLVALYRKQHFVNATSPYGLVRGSGWYDENSTATILLQPPMISEAGVLFLNWTGDLTDRQPRTMFFVNSPKTIEARWGTIGKLNESNYFDALVAILPSAAIFAILLIFSLRLPLNTLGRFFGRSFLLSLSAFLRRLPGKYSRSLLNSRCHTCWLLDLCTN
jgi:hypothetical protein